MLLWWDGEEIGDRMGAMTGAAAAGGEVGRGDIGATDGCAARDGTADGAGAALRTVPCSRRRTASAASDTWDIA